MCGMKTNQVGLFSERPLKINKHAILLGHCYDYIRHNTYPLSVIHDEKGLMVQPETVLESVLLLGN